MFIIVWSYKNGWLLYGIIVIYLIMAVLFFLHIAKIRARLARGVSAFATVTDYYESRQDKGVYPIVSYTTEDGRDITSTYTVRDKKRRYDTGSEVMICYDPEDPMFFYFPEREGDMTRDYTMFIIIGGIIACILFIAAQIK